MRDTPDARVSKPPPLIGAVLPVRELATTVSEPECAAATCRMRKGAVAAGLRRR
jgi:hypothetical protein